MYERYDTTQDERVLAALAHGSIVIGPLTGGVGGAIAAFLIWLSQRNRSKYAAFQSLQATVYQLFTIVVLGAIWTCWGVGWLGMTLTPVIVNPGAYEATPPAGMWIGLLLGLVPLALGALIVLYGLFGAVRCLAGHDFRYALIGRWLGRRD